MAFKLYNAPQSTCSQRVRFVLNAKGLPFDEEKLNLLAGDQLKPEYLKLNPNGVVPTLDHDGADRHRFLRHHRISRRGRAGRQLHAATIRSSARAMRALMRFIDEMPAAAVRVPTFNLAFLPRFAAMSRGGVRRVRGEQAAAQGVHAGDGPDRLSARRRWMARWPGCAAPTSAWTRRSRLAAGRGCSARTSRSPTSR